MRRYIPTRVRTSRPAPHTKRERTRPLETYTLPNGATVQGWFHKDVASPDGMRFECINPIQFRKIVVCVREMAADQCEKCETPHYIGAAGHPHHVRNKKVGGGSTDDRIVVAGERQLVWVCPDWHRRHHDGRER